MRVECGGLNENAHRFLCLSAWSPGRATVWGGLRGAAQLEEGCPSLPPPTLSHPPPLQWLQIAEPGSSQLLQL